MKSAEDWIEVGWITEVEDSIESRNNARLELIKAIQLDAWKQGMLDAADSCKHVASLLTDDTKLITVLTLNSAYEALTKVANKATSIDETQEIPASKAQS